MSSDDFEARMRAIDKAIASSNDPAGKEHGELADISEWHAALTNLACECGVCTLVYLRQGGAS
jgi:hypothetical protein